MRYAEPLVVVKCRECDWSGKVLRFDAMDHPCPQCGKYLALMAPHTAAEHTESTSREGQDDA